MSSRGLPGFLRRTLRVDYSFEEDGEDGNDTHEEEEVQQDEDEEQSSSSLDPREQDQEEPSEHSNNEETIIFSADHSQQLTTQPGASEATTASFTSRNGSQPTNQLYNIQTRASANGSLQVDAAAAASRDSITSTEEPRSPSMTVSSKYSATSGIPPISIDPEPQHHHEEPPRSYRDVQFDKVMSADVINMDELRKLSWNGIPSRHRAQAWKILLGYLPTNQSRRAASLQRKRSEYKDACAQHYEIDDDTRTAQEQETLRQVLVDVPRTAPEVALFRNDRIRRILARLLYVWAMRHPASSYVQGINDLATPLLVVFLADYYQGEDVLDGHVMNHLSDERLGELEADVYWCLTNLLSGIQDHYTSDQPGLQRMVARLEELVHRIDTDLTQHLEEMGVQFLQFSFRWMNCLLLREFELKCIVRLWDTYISERDGFEGFHVYVCAAFLCQFSPQLQAMSFDELLGFMQKIPTQDWTDTEIEMLLSQAFVLSTLFGGSDAHLTSGSAR